MSGHAPQYAVDAAATFVGIPNWSMFCKNLSEPAATLTPEHALQIDGAATASFSGAAIAALAKRLRPDDAESPDNPVGA